MNKQATRLGHVNVQCASYKYRDGNSDECSFIDVPSPSLEFVPGSVQINGIPQVGLDPFVGFSLPDLAVGDSVLITFEVNARFRLLVAL